QLPSLTPPSLGLYLGAGGLAMTLVATLPDTAPRQPTAAMLRLPAYPSGALSFGLAILLAWATVGIVIAILPSVLATHGLAAWAGFATFAICSCGVLFQPWARRLSSQTSVKLGLVILPLAYGLIAWGALQGSLMAVLLGTLAASSACYGFVYLGGLSGVMALAGSENNASASAGFFLMAYLGFSFPVVVTGLLIDAYGQEIALACFGIALVIGSVGVGVRIQHRKGKLEEAT
ncbi:MFS transporter, partial [Halomonas sp. BBD48]|nr:MFS transporter [Halomonas sp. BBD48]